MKFVLRIKLKFLSPKGGDSLASSLPYKIESNMGLFLSAFDKCSIV